MAAARKQCRYCTRPVQPGLTKALQPYETCCRSCAKNEGRGKFQHDANCGGASLSGAETVAPVGDPSQLLSRLVANPAELKARVDQAFASASDGHSRLGYNQLKTAIATLMQPFGGLAPGVRTSALKDKFDVDQDGMISQEEFGEMAKFIVEKETSRWFPVLLPSSVAQFVVANSNELEDVYQLGKKLGEGTFGKVYACTHKVSGEKRVVKKVSMGLAGMDKDMILVEIHNMAVLDHPNVVKVYEYFEDDDEISQIMEPIPGGELMDRINAVFEAQTAPFYGERFIADVIKQTLRALAFMHSKRFMHKDLKPQNIMMTDKTGSSLKVIDFGMAEMFSATQHKAEELGGTALYMAPEGARIMLGMAEWAGFQGLTFKSDIWSTGVILYQLITGEFPFCGAWPAPDVSIWQQETMQKIATAPMPDHPRLAQVSSPCRQLLRQMLEKDINSRPDANQCLQSQWFSQQIQAPANLSPGIMQSLVAYSELSELKRTMFFLMSHLSALPALEELRVIFTHFDRRNQGTLDQNDVRQLLTRGGMPPYDIKRVLHALDRSGSGDIYWTEFCAGTLSFKLANSKRLIDAAFGYFDEESEDALTVENFEYKLAMDPVPRQWQGKWSQYLPSQFEEMKTSCEAPEPDSGPCAFLCPPPEPDEDTLTRGEFENYMGQKLKLRAGNKYHTVE